MTFQRRRLVGLVVALAGLALGPTAALAASAEEASVGEALEAMRKAMLAADKSALEALFLPEATYGHSDGLVQSKDEFIADTVGKKTAWKSLTLSDPGIVVSGDTAVARVSFAGEAEQRGKVITPKIKVLIVYRKQGGAWKILARQGYATPHPSSRAAQSPGAGVKSLVANRTRQGAAPGKAASRRVRPNRADRRRGRRFDADVNGVSRQERQSIR